jgi:hypothetical protein
MFSTNFSNKTKLKIKNIFFVLLGQTRFNAFLALNRTGPAGTVAPFSHYKNQQRAASCNLRLCHILMVGPIVKNCDRKITKR